MKNPDDHTSGGCSSGLPAMVPLVGVLDTSGRSPTGPLGVAPSLGTLESRTVTGSIPGVRTNRKSAVGWPCAYIEHNNNVPIPLDHPIGCPEDKSCTPCTTLVSATPSPPITHRVLGTAVGVCSPESIPGTSHEMVSRVGVVVMTSHIPTGGPSVASRIDIA